MGNDLNYDKLTLFHGYGITFQTGGNGPDFSKTRMFINNVGKVGIGTFNLNGDYNLFVTKGIRTEKVQVDVASLNGWADYVFEPTYRLRSLVDVEKYIKENKHLPEVPSAKSVTETGINIAEMDATLLKKVEELTLYMIDQNKQLQNLKKANEKLNKELQALKGEK